MIFAAVVFVVTLACYCVWWERLYTMPPGERDLHAIPPITVHYRFNAWLPRLILFLRVRDPKRRAHMNFAITLPHPFRRAIIVLVARSYIVAEHRAHEAAGHGWQVLLMGPVDYTATYTWHFILRRGSLRWHMMEIQAETTTRAVVHLYRDLGVVPLAA